MINCQVLVLKGAIYNVFDIISHSIFLCTYSLFIHEKVMY